MATNVAAVSDAPAGKIDRRANGSPPAQPSKRDKRRHLILDRIGALEEKFGRDRDQKFREALQRVQIDTQLVMKMDPYLERFLDDFEENQRKNFLLAEVAADGDAHSGPRTLLDVAGPKFQSWMIELQDLVENRDFTLAKYTYDFDKKSAEYHSTHAYKIETANREHRALSQTLRDRLINTITSKKLRLNREKEALEITDASALLLHPNQFSLTNPSSPGGTHSKRTTRLRREMDDMPGMESSKKRKRNGGGDEDGSPAPQRRALDTSSTTSLWQTDRLTSRKVTGPVYSIDKLFTDKELSMTYNAAALAAHKYILTHHKPRYDENGHKLSSPEDSDSGSGEHDDHDADSPPSAAPTMERNVSHATRSGRGGAHNNPNFVDNKLVGLEALASFDYPGNLERMLGADPKLPPTFPSSYVRGHAKQSDFNTPTALSQDDVNGDLMVMQALRQYDGLHGMGANLSNDNGSRKILEAASHTPRDNRYVAFLQSQRPAENEVRRRLGLPVVAEPETADPSSLLLEPPPVGTPSKSGRSGTPAHQSPAKGFLGGGGPTSVPSGIGGGGSGSGGVSMSRQSSASGAPMSRSSSRKGRSTRAG